MIEVINDGLISTINASSFKELIDHLNSSGSEWMADMLNSKYPVEKRKELGWGKTFIIEEQGTTTIKPTPIHLNVS